MKDKIQVLYFGSSTCKPCEYVKPIVKTMQNVGWDITYVATEDHPDLVTNYDISSVPAFIKLIDGKEVGRHVGLLPLKTFKEFLEKPID